MGKELWLRTDIDAGTLRRLARRETNGRVVTRMLALANAVDGMDRRKAAETAGMDRQTLRDWVIRFNQKGIAGLRDEPHTGRKPLLREGQQAALRAIVLRGPDPDKDGVSSFRVVDLCRIVEERFGIAFSQSGMRRMLKSLDLSWQKTRPKHPQAKPREAEAFKKGAWRTG